MLPIVHYSPFHPLKMQYLLAISAALATSIAVNAALGKRENFENGFPSLVVDLGYEIYQGVTDEYTGFNTWKGYVYNPGQD